MDAHRLIFIGIAAVLLNAAACGPEPTPLPVVAATFTPLPQSANTPVTVVPDNTVQYVVDPVTEEVINAVFADSGEVLGVQVFSVPQLTGAQSEIVLSSQPFAGGQLLPTPFLFGIALNSTGLPLESPEVIQALVEYLRLLAAEQPEIDRLADAQRNMREVLANAGYPDGVRISMDHIIPSLIHDLMVVSVEAVADSTYPAQLQVVFGDTEREAAIAEYGEANVVYGFTLPLYYAVSPGLQIAIGSYGLPILANEP